MPPGGGYFWPVGETVRAVFVATGRRSPASRAALWIWDQRNEK